MSNDWAGFCLLSLHKPSLTRNWVRESGTHSHRPVTERAPLRSHCLGPIEDKGNHVPFSVSSSQKELANTCTEDLQGQVRSEKSSACLQHTYRHHTHLWNSAICVVSNLPLWMVHDKRPSSRDDAAHLF
eukprot:s3001_g2.t1